MNWADVVILVVLALSMLVSLWRGFTREAFSLVVWVAAFWVGYAFAHYPAAWLIRWIDIPSARLALGFLALFLVTLLVGGIVTHLVCLAVVKTGLTGTDRMLGLFFGLARGLVMVSVLVLVAGLTLLPRDPWWNESLFIAHFERAALWLRARLPAEIAERVSYD